MRRVRVGIDVDGPCAAMVEAFLQWFHDERRPWHGKLPYDVTRDMVKYHNDMGASPKIIPINEEMKRWYPGDGPDSAFGSAFVEFMQNPTVYSDWVRPTEDAQAAIELLKSRCDCMFITALMRRANQHIPDKLDWIGRNFPGVPISTVPSEKKCWVHPEFGIDDRYDTCKRWQNEGVTALLFETPWSEVPDDSALKRYDWHSIIVRIEQTLDHNDFLERMATGHA